MIIFDLVTLNNPTQIQIVQVEREATSRLIQENLFFGQTSGTGRRVTEQQFDQFLKDVVTPQFPDGLTVYNASEQFLDRHGNLIREPRKIVSLIYENTAENRQSINAIVNAYMQQFQQDSVLQIENSDVAVGFGQGEDLIDNDPTPELIQIDLYFGRNIGTTERVSDRQFRQFLRDEITPRFPDGLTVYDTNGQFLDRSNRLIRESSNVVSLILEDTPANEQSINQIIDTYKQKFQQESVLVVVDETLNVAFNGEDDSTSTAGLQPTFDFDLLVQKTQQSCFTLSTESSF